MTNRDKHRKCWGITHRAIRKGILVRPVICECCNLEFPLLGKNKLQAHHKDYNCPLDVTWLCDKCHRELHRQLRDIKFGRCNENS